MSCKHARGTDKQNIVNCELGNYGGYPHTGVCFQCPDYSGPARGAGDIIAKITKKVGIKPCGGCQKRREKLNKLLPIKEKQK